MRDGAYVVSHANASAMDRSTLVQPCPGEQRLAGGIEKAQGSSRAEWQSAPIAFQDSGAMRIACAITVQWPKDLVFVGIC